MDYAYVKDMNLGFDAAKEKVTAALAQQGFGVLTEIDVSGVLKKKRDIDFRPYVILGACNPDLAHRALQVAAQVGLLLPCNVVVESVDGGSRVSILNPRTMFQVAEEPALEPIADEADEKLRAALESL